MWYVVIVLCDGVVCGESFNVMGGMWVKFYVMGGM